MTIYTSQEYSTRYSPQYYIAKYVRSYFIISYTAQLCISSCSYKILFTHLGNTALTIYTSVSHHQLYSSVMQHWLSVPWNDYPAYWGTQRFMVSSRRQRATCLCIMVVAPHLGNNCHKLMGDAHQPVSIKYESMKIYYI